MFFLAVDIGGGTQDICYYDSSDIFENSIKLVLPTPSKVIASNISLIDDDLYIDGNIIGGGSILSIIKEKISSGKNVFISQNACATLKDDKEYLKNLDITIVEDIINPNIIFNEFSYDTISKVVTDCYGSFNPDKVLVAVQDHGYIAGQKDRITRFNFLKDFLKNGLKNAFFTEFSQIPSNFTRLKSIYNSINDKVSNISIHISDTAVVGAIGAASVTNIRPIIVVDVGNCHTFAALIGNDDKVYSFFEHHTHLLNRDILIKLLKDLSVSSISNDEIFNNDGHGAYIYEKINAVNCPILVTGPNRQKFLEEKDNIIFAYPKGDTMMAGTVGLLIQAGVKL